MDITDRVIRRCNTKIVLGGSGTQAEKFWGICIEIGVIHLGDDVAMVKVVEGMEARDKLAKDGRGSKKGG